MSEKRVEVKLQDGTLIRHKVAGYEGRIEGTTGDQNLLHGKRRVIGQFHHQTAISISGSGKRGIPAPDRPRRRF